MSGIVMREVDEPTLVVPDVLAVHHDVVSDRERDALADVHVVVDEQRLRRSLEQHDETLMRARWSGVVGEEPRHRAFRRDLDARAMFGERALDRGIPGEGRAAGRDDRAEDDRAEG
jgi:hypothetical protein